MAKKKKSVSKDEVERIMKAEEDAEDGEIETNDDEGMEETGVCKR